MSKSEADSHDIKNLVSSCQQCEERKPSQDVKDDKSKFSWWNSKSSNKAI